MLMADAASAPDQIGPSSRDPDDLWPIRTEALDAPSSDAVPGCSTHVWSSAGPPRSVAPEGILLIYNGADDRLVYRTGWALLSATDPTRVLARSVGRSLRPKCVEARAGRCRTWRWWKAWPGTAATGSSLSGGADGSVGVAPPLTEQAGDHYPATG